MKPKASRRVLARTVATKILVEPARATHWLQVTAAYLTEHNRTKDVDLVLNDIARELYEQSGHLLVDVTSARPLTDAVRREVAQSIKDATGAKHVELTEQVDPSLLGGLIARTPDAQLDLSVRTKLKQLATI